MVSLASPGILLIEKQKLRNLTILKNPGKKNIPKYKKDYLHNTPHIPKPIHKENKNISTKKYTPPKKNKKQGEETCKNTRSNRQQNNKANKFKKKGEQN